jgi:cytosine/adenosine deaminase-related metal-dependent hydrolase
MTTLLARNAAIVVTMDEERRELREAGLFARNGLIEQVAPTDELPTSADVVLDLRGQILLPATTILIRS